MHQQEIWRVNSINIATEFDVRLEAERQEIVRECFESEIDRTVQDPGDGGAAQSHPVCKLCRRQALALHGVVNLQGDFIEKPRSVGRWVEQFSLDRR